jgi:serine/threonine-protein kinase
MTAPTEPSVTRTWAVDVPTGYRVAVWEVVAPIATGNFGSVYAARAVDGDAAVALKFLATGTGSPRQTRLVGDLAARELEFCRTAAHERLIGITETHVIAAPGSDLDGVVVLVMELAEGSLQDRLRETPGRPLPDAARLITEIAVGLAHLHASGWVHGDLKPSNILIMADGSIRLADFGLATHLDGTHGYAPPLGSTDYLPPERLESNLCEEGVQVRPSTDIWAVGVTIHQILTGGALPIPGSTPATRAIAAQEIVAGRSPLRLHPDIDAGWAAIIAGCLSAAPVDAATLLTRVNAHTDHEGRPAPTRHRRRLVTITAIATCTVVAAVVAVVAGYGRHDTAPPTAPPVTIRVYNVETSCQTQRTYSCSLGLAIDPHADYAIGNVSPTRVWHNDVLVTDCVIYDGVRVADETGVGSVRWFRVAVPGGHAWLPGVRTLDNPPHLPLCPE